MALPIFQTADRILSMMQTQWSSMLNPVINNPLNQSILLKNVALVAGPNTVAHRLGRELQGWIPVTIPGAAPTLYDLQATNPNPDKTLIVVSDMAITLNLVVF
jgi:hypothetical protein